MPTRQRHVMRPPVFGPSRFAFETTVSWMTWIVQRARGETFTVSVANRRPSPAMLDKTNGHVLPDALDRARSALDAFVWARSGHPAAEAES